MAPTGPPFDAKDLLVLVSSITAGNFLPWRAFFRIMQCVSADVRHTMVHDHWMVVCDGLSTFTAAFKGSVTVTELPSTRCTRHISMVVKDASACCIECFKPHLKGRSVFMHTRRNNGVRIFERVPRHYVCKNCFNCKKNYAGAHIYINAAANSIIMALLAQGRFAPKKRSLLQMMDAHVMMEKRRGNLIKTGWLTRVAFLRIKSAVAGCMSSRITL